MRESVFLGKSKGKRLHTKSKDKLQKAKGKSRFRLRKAFLATEGIRKKESADLLPFAICLWPFDFKRSL
jgi:hypothetical protein